MIVFFGRFVALLHVFAGPLAGAANVAGAVVWATAVGALGFFFGKPVAAILGSLGIRALVTLAIFFVLRFALERMLERRWSGR